MRRRSFFTNAKGSELVINPATRGIDISHTINARVEMSSNTMHFAALHESGSGTKRTSRPCLVMSAYNGEAEVIEKPRHFRF